MCGSAAIVAALALSIGGCGLGSGAGGSVPGAAGVHRADTSSSAYRGRGAHRGARPGPVGEGYLTQHRPASAWLDRHIWLADFEAQPLNRQQVRIEARMGLNLFWNLAGTPGDSSDEVANFDTIRRGGMHVIAPFTDGETGSETVGFEGEDEPDMVFGAGDAAWRNSGANSACVPATAHCGYTASRFFYDGDTKGVLGNTRLPYRLGRRAVVNSYGKGVLFWDPPAQAARFLRYTDILAADSYWMTDPDLAGASEGGCALLPHSSVACDGNSGRGLTSAQAELPADYAFDVTRLRHLEAMNGTAKPIAVYVETGCPFLDSQRAGRCTTPAAAVAAAWHALIAGAHGIIWFSHNFSGRCFDDHTFIDGMTPSSPLYDCQQTPGVTLHDLDRDIAAFDHEVDSLNAVLLSATLPRAVSTRADVSTLAKRTYRACWVFAAAGEPARPPRPDALATFSLASRYSGPVTVLGERRTVRARDGRFSDRFDGPDAVHVYELPRASACG